jgi:MerR family transcriptional regulator, thiopeptide resistance regulator
MQGKGTYQVSEVAELSGVSVRALHHYDAIGLLVPRGRSAAGYRLYDKRDLLRLQQIVIGRTLGLSLEAIRRSLDDPQFDRRRALTEQRAALEQRAEQAAAMIRAIDTALGLLDAGRVEDDHIVASSFSEDSSMTYKVDMKKIFDGFDPDEHADEAEKRWGHTDAYKRSVARAKSYTEQDWIAVRDEQAAVYGNAYAALKAGKAPSDPEVMDIAERHRLSIDRWFYPCSLRMHAGLADMWESDKRFAENIDRHGGPGLTAFLAAAVRANATRGTT